MVLICVVFCCCCCFELNILAIKDIGLNMSCQHLLPEHIPSYCDSRNNLRNFTTLKTLSFSVELKVTHKTFFIEPGISTK